MPTCSVDGCDRTASARSWCHTHYMRWRNNGSTRASVPVSVDGRAQKMTAEERFWLKVAKTDTCWLWIGSLRGGYGQFMVKAISSTPQRAHRWAYEHFVGPIPDGLTIDHLCRNKACVNPTHLEPVTLRVNILRSDGVSAQHARKTCCPRCGGQYRFRTVRGHLWRFCRSCGTNLARQRRHTPK
jgi:hypothetical protein